MNRQHMLSVQRIIRTILIAGIIAAAGCGGSATPPPPAAEPATLSVIPLPAEVTLTSGRFVLSPSTKVVVSGRDTTLHAVGRYASEVLGVKFLLDFIAPEQSVDSNVIVFRPSSPALPAEGYRMTTTGRNIVVESGSPAGAFYAVQTLFQLLPPGAFRQPAGTAWTATIPSGTIADRPRYGYRGMHLDVGRHFFPVSFIKTYIDLIASYKMNTFHWHLTEDQGWRIEIKKYPRLTSIGGWRKETLIGHYSDVPERYDGKRYGGFYTQDEVREVVAYARSRFVTVIPEIEMPGHAMAALSAYPNLSCTYGPIEAATKWGVFEDIFCSKDSVFTFLENVLTEVVDLFPGTYIHIGGDEAPKARWEACPRCAEVRRRENLKDVHEQQSYFIRRIEKFLNAKGRRIIGWDEILEGGLAPNATVMSWRGEVGGITAAREGHDVIMSPTSHCYFDFYQGYGPEEPLAIGSFLPVRKVYDYEPTPDELSATHAKHVLGAQGNVWTEYIPTEDHVQYMVLPRMPALAEVLWTPRARRNFDSFADRVASSLWRWDRLGYTYATHLLDADYQIAPATSGLQLILTTRDRNAVVRYTLDGSDPTAESPAYRSPIPLRKDVSVRAVTFRDGTRSRRMLRYDFAMHKAAGKPIGLDAPPHPTFGFRGRQALVNGVFGSDVRFADGEWLGWYRWPLDATIDLRSEVHVDSVVVRLYNSVPEWIWLPKEISVGVSSNGKDFTTVARHASFDHASLPKVVRVTVPVGRTTQYLRVTIPNYGTIPEGKPGAGNYTWLFVDEIVVR